MTALVAAQFTAAAPPGQAAEIVASDPLRSQQVGTFVGARVQVPLDGVRHTPRATLTAAPALHSMRQDGESRLRIGQGLEFGLVGEQVRLDFAGRPVSRLVQGPDAPGGPRSNVSTVGWAAIGVGVAAVTLFVLYGLCGSGEICDTEDD